MKTPKPKLKSHSKLVKELDEVYSLWLRLSLSVNGMVKCFTCPAEKPVKEMHCGHFQSRKHMATRWHIKNTKPQCVGCNIFKQGQQYKFGRRLDKEYGAGTADAMEALSKQTCKYSKGDLLVLIAEYKEKIKNECNA